MAEEGQRQMGKELQQILSVPRLLQRLEGSPRSRRRPDTGGKCSVCTHGTTVGVLILA